jgi:hypothetical protein
VLATLCQLDSAGLTGLGRNWPDPIDATHCVCVLVPNEFGPSWARVSEPVQRSVATLYRDLVALPLHRTCSSPRRRRWLSSRPPWPSSSSYPPQRRSPIAPAQGAERAAARGGVSARPASASLSAAVTVWQRRQMPERGGSRGVSVVGRCRELRRSARAWSNARPSMHRRRWILVGRG